MALSVVFVSVLLAIINVANGAATVSIDGTKFKINGQLTYPNAKDENVRGVLLNERMIQGLFDDANSSTVHLWAYPDTKKWDPDRNVNELIGNLSRWHDNYMRAFTVGLQGGCPYGYCGSQPWIVSAYDFKTGDLVSSWTNRLKSLLEKADDAGMVVIVQLFYPAQTEKFNKDNTVIQKAIDNILTFLNGLSQRNFLIEIANECNNGGYSGTIVSEKEVPNTINSLKKKYPHFYFASSVVGNPPSSALIGASDFVLVHGNGKSPQGIVDMIDSIRSDANYTKKPKPIVFNEDDMQSKYNFNDTSNNMEAAVSRGVSWGLFIDCKNDAGDYKHGYQCPPTDWNIDTNIKRGFAEACKNWTKS